MSEGFEKLTEMLAEAVNSGSMSPMEFKHNLDKLRAQMKHDRMMKASPRTEFPNKNDMGLVPVRGKPSPWDKLCMRMDWELVGAAKRRKLELFNDGGYVFVMGVVNGEPFTIKDDENLFPSDQVVTQLRLLYNGE